jgi:hypothetical protein
MLRGLEEAGMFEMISEEGRRSVLQTPWDCRWSRPGYRLTNVRDERRV